MSKLPFLLFMLASLLVAVSAQTNATTAAPSFCEICRDKGNCAQAYEGRPGIFCGAWLNAASHRMACCCPADGQCAKTSSNYKCLCSGKPTTKSSSPTIPKSAVAVSVGLAGALALL